MTYEQVRTVMPEAFKRFCGVQATTFSEMVTALKQKQQEKRKTGRPAKLSLEDQVLLTLQKRAIPHLLSHCPRLEYQ